MLYLCFLNNYIMVKQNSKIEIFFWKIGYGLYYRKYKNFILTKYYNLCFWLGIHKVNHCSLDYFYNQFLDEFDSPELITSIESSSEIDNITLDKIRLV